MRCAWNELLALLPPKLRQETDMLGRHKLQEIRLRLGRPVQLVLAEGGRWLEHTVRSEDLSFVVNAASSYSPWAAATSRQGYITAPGGHRVGLCGECIVQSGVVSGIRSPTSVCIRVARDFPGLAKRIQLDSSCLIIGPPGSGKTTLLRDVVRQISSGGCCVAVVDERGELFPVGSTFDPGAQTDVLTGCGKEEGILMVLKTMGPQWIAIDEVTARGDCEALLQACRCGVRLIATAHAFCTEDLRSRPVYRPLLESKFFDTVIVLQQDKSFRTERIR